MHDVLDPRDLVPDEAEQLAHSGYQVATLGAQAQEAAAAGDLERLAAVGEQLANLERAPGWDEAEPEGDALLLETAAKVDRIDVDPQRLPGRVHGA
ncbi:MAG: ADP-ribosylglycohydrolase family protein, partial [Nocardioidaceae bacterium]